MRRLVGVLVVLLATPSFAGEPSNPAFLGVGMHDINPPAGPCIIETVTKDSGAHLAGLRPNDVFVSLDGTPIPNCDALVQQIQAREPGVTVKLDIRRGSMLTAIDARLNSRADVLRQRIVGQTLPLATYVRVDAETTSELAPRGTTTIVGWFDQKCANCERVFGQLARWAREKSTQASPIVVYGATAGETHPSYDSAKAFVPDALKQRQRQLDVPLLVADPETYADLAITDVKRITFMVIDGRGVVQYAAPLKPDADDKVAVLDELFAATEQAARRAK